MSGGDSDHEKTMSGRDIDSGWAWVVLGVAVFNLTILGAVTMSVGIFQAEFLQHFEESTAYVSLAGSLCAALQMLAGPIASFLCSCIGIRLTLMVGSGFLALGMISASFVSSLPQLIICFGVIGGFGFGTTYTTSAILVSYYFKEKRVLTNGIALSSTGLGMMSGPHLLGWLIDHYGWRYALVVFHCILAQMIVTSSLVFPLNGHTKQADEKDNSGNTRHQDGDRLSENSSNINEEENKLIECPSDDHIQINNNNGENLNLLNPMLDKGIIKEPDYPLKEVIDDASHIPCSNQSLDTRTQTGCEVQDCSGSHDLAEPQTASDKGRPLSGLLQYLSCCFGESSSIGIYKSKVFWMFGLHFYLQVLGYSIQIVHLPSYALSVGVTSPQVPTLFTAYGITVTITRLLAGVVLNRIAKYILLIYINLQGLMGIVMAAMPLWANNFIGLVVYEISFAVAAGTSFVLLPPISVEFFGVRKLATAFGGILFLGGISYLNGPPLSGALFDATSSYSSGFHIGGLMIFLGGIVLIPVLVIKRRRNRRQGENAASQITVEEQ